MDGGDDVGSRDVEDLVAALELLVVLEARVLLLDHGPHGAVGDDHAGAQGLGEGGGSGVGDVVGHEANCNAGPHAGTWVSGKQDAARDAAT
ncbi:hypothetical protein D3C74_370930 [compost metagenome]